MPPQWAKIDQNAKPNHGHPMQKVGALLPPGYVPRVLVSKKKLYSKINFAVTYLLLTSSLATLYRDLSYGCTC
jgi:hypothetical protein